MTKFNIDDVVRLKTDSPKRLRLIVRSIDSDRLECTSECERRRVISHGDDFELVERPDPQADMKQAIREVLLSDEFMTAFAAAFLSATVPRSALEHPIPGFIRPMRSEAQLSKMVEMVRQSLTTESSSPKILDDSSEPWTPKVGERVRLIETGDIYEIGSYSETYAQYSMQGWPGSCVNLEDIEPVNCPEIPDSSSEPSNPANEQPPKGYRFLTTQDFWAKFDECIGTNERREQVPKDLIGKRVDPHAAKNRYVRRCEFDRGEKVSIQFVEGVYKVNGKEPGHVDCYSVQLEGCSSRKCRTVDAKNLIPLELRTTPPPKRYREPTKDDLKNGPIACEYRGCDDEHWRGGFLNHILNGAIPFLCVDEQWKLSGQWEQCRIEVAE